jgi:leader peptidase (prepilin peptidase) / N-methyltransferase
VIILTVVVCAALGWLVGSYLPGLTRRLIRDELTGFRTRPRVAEAVTAVVFALLALRLGPEADLPAFLYAGAVGVLLAFVDLEVRRLPNVLTFPSYPIAAALLGAAAFSQQDTGAFLRALAGMAALYAFYLLLLVLHPAGMGWGDVKLAGVLGLYLGWLGWGTLVSGAFLGFLLGGITGVVLIVVGRATRKSSIPFGPYMLLGALLAVVWGSILTDAYVARLTG